MDTQLLVPAIEVCGSPMRTETRMADWNQFGNGFSERLESRVSSGFQTMTMQLESRSQAMNAQMEHRLQLLQNILERGFCDVHAKQTALEEQLKDMRVLVERTDETANPEEQPKDMKDMRLLMERSDETLKAILARLP